MVERHFYKLHRLTDSDIEFLRLYIQQTGSPVTRPFNQELVRLFEKVAIAHEIVKDMQAVPLAEREKIRKLLIEAEDRLHEATENSAVPILEQLRLKKTEFINSTETATVFFIYIAQQYYRTKKMRELIRNFLLWKSPIQASSNSVNVFCFVMACNIAGGLLAESDSLDIVFLENRDPGFVSGDQPIINLLANRFGGKTTDYVFYYPLSPHLSCLLTHKTRNLQSKHIPAGIANKLNGLISWHSNQFLIGDSPYTIQLAIKNQPTPNQTVRDIFDYLTVIP